MSSEPQARPDPGFLMKLSTAYWDSQTLLTANRVGLFGLLAESPLGVDAIAGRLGTQPRPTLLLLNACVGLGLLEKDGERFRNSAASQSFLVPGRPGYLGTAFRYSDNLYGTWGQLETALREGRPPMPPAQYLGDDRQLTRDFVYGMHERALGAGRVLVNLVDLAGRRMLFDIGGGPGTYAALFAQRCPELRALVMDLPGVVAHAGEIVASMGVAERVKMVPGDYTQTPFPPGQDVVLISGVFHREHEERCRDLIARAYASLTPGGLLLVSDVFADAGGTHPAFAALFGLNMMLTAPDGGVHADVDVATWIGEAGFSRSEIRPFPPPMPHRLVVGEK